MAASVFISYSSQNSKEVAQVLAALHRAGISYWKAPEMIPAGSNYAREIPQAISACKVFLLVLSEQSQQSIWVEKELDCAINCRKPIVPLKIGAGEMSELFRFYLNNVQVIDYTVNREKALLHLTQRLAILTAESGESDKEVMKARPKERGKTVTMAEADPNPDGATDSAHNSDISPMDKNGAVQLTQQQKQRMRINALRRNEVPVVCEKCGGELAQISRGSFRCKKCGNMMYDSYQKVRDYLEKNGPKPISEIAKMTGVPRASVEYFLREELLEIPRRSPVVLTCAGCGCAIRTGTLCVTCKEKRVKPASGDGKSRYRFIKTENRSDNL